MTIKILKTTLAPSGLSSSALIFIPKESIRKNAVAVFTHGYTSHKGDLLSWATKISEFGIPTAIFDLPGHYLGSGSEVASIEIFEKEAPKLFKTAVNKIFEIIDDKNEEKLLILGGHSLGGLMSLQCFGDDFFPQYKKQFICVGLGQKPLGEKHLLQSQFYQNTLKIREQLVSKALNSSDVFSWIENLKHHPKIENENIHLITGQDDLVVGTNGLKMFKESLEINSNNVTVEEPPKLPHHEPERASSFVKKKIKELNIT